MQRGLADDQPLRPRPAGRLAVVLRLAPDGRRSGSRSPQDWATAGPPVTRTLVVTNDFPPRQGGIQTFVAALLARRPPDSLVVLASDSPGSAALRRRAAVPGRPAADRRCCCRRRATARAAADLARRHGCDSAFFGAAAPLGLLAPGAARGRRRPPGRRHPRARDRLGGAARRRGSCCSASPAASTCSPTSASTRAAGWRRRSAAAPGWPSSRPGSTSTGSPRTPTAPPSGGGTAWATRPVVVCVSRLVPRKGQDVLVAGWPRVLARHPDARLLLVGGGPAEASLRRAVAGCGLAAAPSSSPGRWPPTSCPAHYAAGDVFAMPCRTRRAGLDVEGLGMVFLEAAACGLPVVAGTSGGAPEAVQEGVTGHVVDPRSPDAVADGDRRPARRPGPRARDGRGRPGLGRAALVLDDDRRHLRRPAPEARPRCQRRGRLAQRA